LSRPEKLSPQGHILEAAIEAAATEVVNLRDNLNEWDNKVGDGDCGSTVGLWIAYLFPFICSPCYLHLISSFVKLQMFRGAVAILEDMKK